jgi:hypothetical protein
MRRALSRPHRDNACFLRSYNWARWQLGIQASLPEDAAAKKKCPPCKKRNKQGKCKKKKPN